MKISVELTFTPLKDDYEPHIIAFIKALRNSEFKVLENPLSTQVYGDYNKVMSFLQLEIEKAFSNVGIAVLQIKLVKTIYHAYSKTPLFSMIYPLLEKQILLDTKSSSDLLINSIITISKYLKIKTKFIKSSDLDLNKNLKGQDRIINICKYFNTSQYINLAGGRNLYEKVFFEMNNIQIFFLEPNLRNSDHVSFTNESYLSIIDLLMNKESPKIKNDLNKFKLV